ncbi:MAG: HAMP domain-containing protein [SAR324 cluster bacterium]|nr:HAMP domain-containing protein [SAR324 cluster bacterium]
MKERLTPFFSKIFKINQLLNMRQKLFIAFSVFALASGMLGTISYYNLVRVEDKIFIVETAEDISKVILEIKHYEKNFFLYARESDAKETFRLIDNALQLAVQFHSSIGKIKLVSHLNVIIEELKNYRVFFEQITLIVERDSAQREQLTLKLRGSWQILKNLSNHLVVYERQQILLINSHLKDNILILLLLFAGLSILLVFFIQRQVIYPLGVIVRTTKSIADGRFEKVEVGNKKDEIQKVMLAFNKMVSELERRQDQLIEAQKLSAIGTLASGIAHQVNNPLNNISTSCQILLEDFSQGCSGQARKMMTNIEKETFRARDIVRGLLEFSRSQEFVLTENRLVDVVERSLKLIASQVPPGVEIIQQVPEEISFWMDRQRMQELFLNLLLNAIHAIAPDPGKIFITAKQNLSEHKVKIRIEDSGTGIPEEIRKRVFDPFFTTKAEGIGTGLGLYIVYNIVKKHNGEIRVENRITRGSRFVIDLPLD